MAAHANSRPVYSFSIVTPIALELRHTVRHENRGCPYRVSRSQNVSGIRSLEFDCEFRAARRNIDQGAGHQGAALAGVEPGTLTFFLADLAPHRESHDDIPLRYQQYDHCPANLTSIS